MARKRRTFRDELVTGLISAGLKELPKEENREVVATIARYVLMVAAVLALLMLGGVISTYFRHCPT